MRHPTQPRRGFSLIELLIVVSVLAILAAIVVPRFSNAGDKATSGALVTQLRTIKQSLVRYSSEHGNDYPTEAQLVTNQWQVLTNSTDIDGDVSGSDYGPYFNKPPFNGFMDSDVIATDNSGAWQYDPSTGVVRAVVPQAIYDRAEELSLPTGDLVVAP
ncbi:MAG: type II secretion system protein [Phycisphaeraceae bacterium]